MAVQVSTNLVSIQRPHPIFNFHPSSPLHSKSFTPLHLKSPRFRSIACQRDPTLSESFSLMEKPIVEPGSVNDNPSQAATSTPGGSLPELSNKDVNRRIAVFFHHCSCWAVLIKHLDFGVSLNDLSALAVPYEEWTLKTSIQKVAMKNGGSLSRPYLMETYSCGVLRRLVRSK